MPPKKNRTSIAEVPNDDSAIINKFIDSFTSVMKGWEKYYELPQEFKIHVLKDGKYIEEPPPDIISIDETQSIKMTYKSEVAIPIIEKQYSREFTEEQLQSLSLEQCKGDTVEEEEEDINIGLGFDKDGIFNKIQIHDAKIPEVFMEIFTVIKRKYSTITKLHLIDCDLKGKHIIELGKFLRDYQTVKDVCLDMNPIHEQNYDVLIRKTGVEHLSLRNSKIDCLGVNMITRALVFEFGIAHKLLSLNLNGNMIHDDGLIAIAQSLRSNFTLQSLSVAKNFISTYGIMEFSNVLQKFPLTHHENLDRRFSYLKYIEKTNAEIAENESSNQISSPSNSNSKSGPSKNRSNSGSKRLSKRLSKVERKENTDNETSSSISVSDIIACNLHPLLATTCEENGTMYSVGNFSLRFLNFSYNWCGIKGLEALMKAVKYQVEMGPQKSGPGLMHINVEGWYLCEDEKEGTKIKEILLKRYIPPTLDKRMLFEY